MNRPTRIVLNFSHRCNLACEWCYIPFNDPRPVAEVCQNIVTRSAEIGISNITFGGGDPFIYPFLGKLVLLAKHLGLFVHIDTNGIAMRRTTDNADLFRNFIDLVGLPIDGPNPGIHGQMRSSRRHFRIVMDRVDWLVKLRQNIKVNTLVTSRNIDSVSEIAYLVASIVPSRWSLYQYWPLSDGASVRTRHEVGDAAFKASTEYLAGLPSLSGIKVEVNSLLSRRLTYPFVNQEGILYIHSQHSRDDYERLGSIFIDSVVDKMFSLCRAEREVASSRY